jgi:hypothetical protein
MSRFAPILAALLCAACVRTIELGRAIEPKSPTAGRSSERAGVICTEKLLAHVARGSHYALPLGEPLCDALFKSVENSYRAAERETKRPYPGEFGRVIEFDVQSSALDVRRQSDGAIRAIYSISVVVARYGRDLKPVSRQAVNGNGIVERRDGSDAVVRDAVEAALQELADRASTLLVAEADGPRVSTPAGR